MDRNQAANYAKKLLDFSCEPNKKIGEGRCIEWEQKVSAKVLSERSRRLLKLSKDDTISLSQIRSWSRGMKFPASFKQGPPKTDDLWLVKISWSAFVKIIVEVLCAIFGQHQETVQSPSLPPATVASPPPSTARPTPLLHAPSTAHSSPAGRNSSSSMQTGARVDTGDGVLTDCLTEWVLHHQFVTLSDLPLDVGHPPRLQVCWNPQDLFYEFFVCGNSGRFVL